MENEQRDSIDPHNLCTALIRQQQKSTREIDELPMKMRPAPAGSEDSAETHPGKGILTISNKPELFYGPSLTPRRVMHKQSINSHGFAHSSDEDKLAPLGFEPEGIETCTPPIERWSSDLLDMLNDTDGFKLFYGYLKDKNCQILLDFWNDCEEFKRMAPTSPQIHCAAAKAIFQTFFQSKCSPLLEITDATRCRIAQQVNDSVVDCHLFDEALSMALANLKNNHFSSFLDFAQAGFVSPKGLYDRHCVGKFQGSYLPPLLEEKELGLGDIEEDNFEQQPKCAGHSGTSGKRSACEGDLERARNVLQYPVKELHSPYYYPSAPLQSVRESENQSVSSGALTEDSMSITTDSDGYSRCSGGRRHRSSSSQKRMQNSGLPNLSKFVSMTQRMPKERHTLPKEEFARILIEKLEIVKKAREQQVKMTDDNSEMEVEEKESEKLGDEKVGERRHAGNTSEAGKGMSILDRAISNKKIMDKIPLSTMVYEQTRSLSSGSHHSSTYSKASATNGTLTMRDSLSSGHTNKISHHSHSSSKASKQDAENAERLWEPPDVNDQLDAVADEEMKRPPREDDDIPMITVDHRRILQWIEQGEEELQRQEIQRQRSRDQKPPKHHSQSHSVSSRNCSKKQSSRSSDRYPSHLPSQPIAQDPLMPPLPQPEPGTMLEEVKRRLIERDQSQKRSKQKQRSRHVDDNDVMACREKASSSSCCCSATDCSSCSQSVLSFEHRPAPSCLGSSTMSSIPSSASCVQSDSRSKDSGISNSTRAKERRNKTVITYYMWGEPIPYRTSFDSKSVTLGQFKSMISRKGHFRYFFKRETGDRECAVVWEDVKDDSAELPTYDGKIVGKVEKVDSA